VTSILPLSLDRLYQDCDPNDFSFEISTELKDLDRMLGQTRAVEAIELGIGLNLDGFNLFILGPPGTGRHSFIQEFLQEKAKMKAIPSDWCYVNNFDDPRKPRAIELPAGIGYRFRNDMKRLIDAASSTIPAAFESEDYHSRRHAIEEQAKKEQESAFEKVRRHAEELGLGIIQTATAFTFVPLSKGKAIKLEEYNKLSEEEKKRVQEDTEKVGQELHKMLHNVQQQGNKVRENIHNLNREVALFAVNGLLEELLQEYGAFSKVVEFLKDLQQDIADHVDLFAHGTGEEGAKPLKEMISRQQDIDRELSVYRRYGVNLLVDRGDVEGPPVVFEDHPTYCGLVGEIEHIAKMGTLSTDFNLICPGALHMANGGYLIIDAAKLLVHPFAWDGLKRALKARKIDIKSLEKAYGLVSTTSLEPDSIPLNVKVVLIGDRRLYYLLHELDPEFLELFKVAADFEDDMERSQENVQDLSRLIASIARREKLKPLNKNGMARLIEESARHAGDAKMLSTHVRRLVDIAREAHYWADRNGRGIIGSEEVLSAIDGQNRRMSRIRDRLQRETLRNTILIDTKGEAIGQINGLSLLRLGSYAFGRPTRITARLSPGPGKVIDIEREVELGGPIHSKGVLILTNFLASNYVTDRPLSLSASLVFEQSYGPIEGDSASAAELCALLSALAKAPIKQTLAVTGSVNQFGQIQAIGGVNQKIEGFFDLCQARGLSGEQGVVIPMANVQHLMLRREVITAAEENRFRIYAVETINQCMQVLTGIDAGERDEQGYFPNGTLNQRITAQLIDFAEKRRHFMTKNQEKE
jgi:lon-related putative ATP-dependent protease